jgi:ABC-type phosphate/phosphonate transport system ATPase subunit
MKMAEKVTAYSFFNRIAMSEIAMKRNKQLSPANTKKLAGLKILVM